MSKKYIAKYVKFIAKNVNRTLLVTNEMEMGKCFFRSVQMKERKGATRKWKRLVSLLSNASKIKTNAYTSSFVPSNARIIETKAYTSSFVPSNACAGAHQIPFIHFSICTSVHFSIRL